MGLIDRTRQGYDFATDRMIEDIVFILKREREKYSLGRRIEGGEDFNYPISWAVFKGKKGIHELVDYLWAERDYLRIKSVTVDGSVEVEFYDGIDRVYTVELDELFRSVSLPGI